MPGAFEKCYPAGKSTPLCAAGYVLIVVGVILLFACIPCWAWYALVGLGCMAAGVLILKLCNAWR